MLTKYRLLALTMVLAVVTVIVIAACSPAEPQIVEVTKVVTEQVEVTKVVTEQVEVEKIVEKVEVEKIVEKKSKRS